jgi:glycine cleavage system transcriptional repressor
MDSLQALCSQAETTLGLSLTIKPFKQSLIEELTKDTHPYLISVAGRDRTGITYHVSKLLEAYEANITDLNAHTIDGEDGPVYVMVTEVDLPKQVNPSQLEAALLEKGRELDLDIRFRSIEAVAL